MGRFQRYVQCLPEPVWRELWWAAQNELGKASLELLRWLRESRTPVKLRGSQKEQVQRLERWVWRYQWVAEQRRYPVHRPAPLVWLTWGAFAYRRYGLESEALGLLRQVQQRHPWPFEALLTEVEWHTQANRFSAASQTLRRVAELARRLQKRAYIQRLQLFLVRLFHVHGGSYTAPAHRLLGRVGRLHRWTAPLPTEPVLRALERNLRGTHALLQGDLSAALEWYQPDSGCSPAHAIPLHLNRWLCLLYQGVPAEQLFTALRSMPIPPLSSVHYQSLFLERCMLTLLQYGSLSEIQRWVPYIQQAFPPAAEFAGHLYLLFGQLSWLAQGITWPIGRFWENTRKGPADLLQAHFVELLIAVEEKNIRILTKKYQSCLYFLNKERKNFASSAFLLRVLRTLYATRLQPRTVTEVVRAWERHLAAYPVEQFFWRRSLLPFWITARMQGMRLREFFAGRLSYPPLWDFLIEHLLRPSGP